MKNILHNSGNIICNILCIFAEFRKRLEEYTVHNMATCSGLPRV